MIGSGKSEFLHSCQQYWVSILVVLDDWFGQHLGQGTRPKDVVSILVVLDDWFGRPVQVGPGQVGPVVSILVVLDDWFGRTQGYVA